MSYKKRSHRSEKLAPHSPQLEKASTQRRRPSATKIKYNPFLKRSRTSLVAQWIRTPLPIHGTWVRTLAWEDPTCGERLSSGATTTEAAPRHYRRLRAQSPCSVRKAPAPPQTAALRAAARGRRTRPGAPSQPERRKDAYHCYARATKGKHDCNRKREDI